jgi:hypothetical protein
MGNRVMFWYIYTFHMDRLKILGSENGSANKSSLGTESLKFPNRTF